MKEDFPTEDDLLMHMGILLLNIQQFESLLLHALKQIYAESADLTAEKLYAEDKRTLGALMTDLRKRAVLEKDADALLESVLCDRNLFVHRLRHQKWFDLSTENGRQRTMEFFAPFFLNLLRATRLFIAIHVKHSDDIGFDSEVLRQIKADEKFKVADYYAYVERIRKKG
jgi:hypothetical protein